MRYRFFANRRVVGAAASAVAAVAHQDRTNRLRRQKAGHQRQVTSHDGMGMELPAKFTLGARRSREDDEAARLLVDAVNDSQSRQLVDGPLKSGAQCLLQAILKRRR